MADGDHHGLGRKPHPETPLARAAYPVADSPLYSVSLATYKYWYEGGAWLDQGNDGTCVGNAFAHRRADSPVPTEGIDEAYARQLYLDASGDTTYQEGTYAILACRVLMDRGTVSSYHWVPSAIEMRNTVLSAGSVCVGIDWFNSMFRPYAKYSNYYLKVDSASGLAGGHEVVINGINLAPTYGKPFYRLKNSWGQSWGKGGTARILCTDLEMLLFGRNGDAVLIAENV